MIFKLWHELRDWQLPHQWKAEDGTYMAGFANRDAALAYGRRNFWL